MRSQLDSVPLQELEATSKGLPEFGRAALPPLQEFGCQDYESNDKNVFVKQ